MSDKNSITINFGLTGLFAYLGIGILYHLITGDGPFAWTDPWLYVTMAIWPFFLLGWVILAIIVIIILFVIAWYFMEERPRAKRLEEAGKQRRAKGEERRRAAAKATPSSTES